MDAAVANSLLLLLLSSGYDNVPRRLLERSEIGNVLIFSFNSDTLSSKFFLS